MKIAKKKKTSHWNLWLAFGLVAAILALIVGFFVYRYQDQVAGGQPSPDKALDQYCTAMQTGDYSTAFYLYSYKYSKVPQAQRGISETQFAQTAGKAGNRYVSCSHSPSTITGSGLSASATSYMTVVNDANKTTGYIVYLGQDQPNVWKIQDIQIQK